MKHTCKYCGEAFSAKRANNRIYCSVKCFREDKMAPYGMKQCTYCKELQPVAMFSMDSSRSDGLNAICKECGSVLRKRYRKSDNGFAVSKNKRLNQRFGITLDEYNEMLEEQGGVCAICGGEETTEYCNGRVRQLAVDHDHRTGEVRGLLCHLCNRGIGMFRDSPIYLERAAEYLSDKAA